MGVCSAWTRLTNSRKMVYMGHRRFLPMDHPYRRNKKSFDGTLDLRKPPQYRDGKEIHKEVRKLEVVLGKGKGKVATPAGSLWKKRSCLWELSYWRHLTIRHSLDAMHLTKNVSTSTLGTLLGIKGKSIDSIEARMDLEHMGVKAELHPITLEDGQKKLLVASWTLKKAKKEMLLSF